MRLNNMYLFNLVALPHIFISNEIFVTYIVIQINFSTAGMICGTVQHIFSEGYFHLNVQYMYATGSSSNGVEPPLYSGGCLQI